MPGTAAARAGEELGPDSGGQHWRNVNVRVSVLLRKQRLGEVGYLLSHAAPVGRE